MDTGDFTTREVLKAAREEPSPERPVVPASAHERATAIFGRNENNDEIKPHSIDFAKARSKRGNAVANARTSATERPARIAIKGKGKILFLDAADLIAVEAKGNYVLLLHVAGSHMMRGSISIIEQKLHLHGFVRIHRSVLVNAALVEEIHPWPTGEYVLRVRGGKEFTVTRTYKKNLQLLAQLWIGTEGFAAD
jgi:DNA-binding LytR/AlgR family response regulator